MHCEAERCYVGCSPCPEGNEEPSKSFQQAGNMPIRWRLSGGRRRQEEKCSSEWRRMAEGLQWG